MYKLSHSFHLEVDQIALDDALVAPADRLKIGKCNLRLSSDVTSKEATLQVVYDVLKLTPFYKAFRVTADAPEIYMQEFWDSAYFVEPPLEKEILAFLANLGHSGDIRKITDVNVNKLHQPWRSFAAIINKCLSGKPSYDSLRLSQAQILWGTIPPKTKGSKKKANTYTITKQKPPTAPKEKNSRQETHSSLASGSSADEGTGVAPGLTTHDDDIIHEEETDEDDSFDPTIHTPSRISSSDDEDSDNEVEGANVEGAKSDEDTTYDEDQGNKAVEDTNTDI
ncbi:hypothetical protein Tco_1458735 [Tanacetum coccineum]